MSEVCPAHAERYEQCDCPCTCGASVGQQGTSGAHTVACRWPGMVRRGTMRLRGFGEIEAAQLSEAEEGT